MENNKKDMQLNNIDSIKMELKALKYPSTRKEFERRKFLLDAVRKYNNDMIDAALELEELNMRDYNSSDSYNRGTIFSWDEEPQKPEQHSHIQEGLEKDNSCLILCDIQIGIDDEDNLNNYINKLSRNLNLDKFDIIISTKLKNIDQFRFKNSKEHFNMESINEIKLASFAESNSDVIFYRDTKSIFTSELNEYIRVNKIDNIYLFGYDLCTSIIASAFDALKFGYNLHIIPYLCSTSHLDYQKRGSLEILKINTPEYLLDFELYRKK